MKALLTWSLFPTPHFSCNSCVCQNDFLSSDTAYNPQAITSWKWRNEDNPVITFPSHHWLSAQTSSKKKIRPDRRLRPWLLVVLNLRWSLSQSFWILQICTALQAVLLKLYANLARGWALIRVKFDSIQEKDERVGSGDETSCALGYYNLFTTWKATLQTYRLKIMISSVWRKVRWVPIYWRGERGGNGLFHLIRVPPPWMTELFAYPGTKILPWHP